MQLLLDQLLHLSSDIHLHWCKITSLSLVESIVIAILSKCCHSNWGFHQIILWKLHFRKQMYEYVHTSAKDKVEPRWGSSSSRRQRPFRSGWEGEHWRGFVAVMNNYQAAAAQAGFPPASPHAAGGHGGPQGRSFPAANSPGPIDMYSSSAAAAAAAAAADSAVASYVQAAASPQPPTTAFPAIAVSRAPLNYSPVSPLNAPPLFTESGPSRE